MQQQTVQVAVEGGTLVGRRRGDGPPVLLLHGGPGMSGDYLEGLVDELADGYDVAWYQQRGVAPSTAGAPYDMATQTADVLAVLDALGWDRATVLGHSFGGHLLLHVLAAAPQRLTAAVVVDPLGGVGDGGAAEFETEMARRVPEADRARAEELDRRAMAGEGTVDDALEAFALFWPSYYADPASAPPPPAGLRMSLDAYSETWASLVAELPTLAPRLAGATVPTVFLHGGSSPMPVSASADTAAAVGSAARLVVLPDTGHMVWHESPGAVRQVLDELHAAG